jgi:predicted short-subunit dehydrogenase-like oxidoreductase (DUF2520 family)
VIGSGPWQIVLVGAGNVAWHLGHALAQKGIIISQVLNRTMSSAKQLANELHAGGYGGPGDLAPDADVCLVCVSDDAIPLVLQRMKPENCLFLHTSGSLSLDVFKGFADRYGVLYPLQTLTRGHPIVYDNIPFLIEANNQDNLSTINEIAHMLSGRVMHTDSQQRLFLHLAAVFAGNFSNHMFALADKLVQERGLPFELLKPLIEETVAKAITISPRKAQTGPAIRGNSSVMEKHLDLLHEHPYLQQLYRLISESIRREKTEDPLA